MAEYDLDKLLKDFESEVSKEAGLDVAMDKEAPLSEKLSEKEIDEAVRKKKKREQDEALKKRIAEIRKQIAEARKEKTEEEGPSEEEAADDVKRAEIIRRLKRILQLRGAERAHALETLGEEFSQDEVERLAIEYVRAAENDEVPAEIEQKKEEAAPVVQAPYAGGGGGVYAAGPEEEGERGTYGAEPEKKIDFSAKKALEETYKVKDNTENKDLFAADKQLEKTYGRASTSEEGRYCDKCDSCDTYKSS